MGGWRAVRGGRDRIRVGACMLGEPVRFDGGHKLDPYVVDILGLSPRSTAARALDDR